jgi:hypothetical protein
MSDLSDFTKLVLARLETNPDEFQLGGRWDTLVRGIEAYVRGDEDDRYYRTLWPLDDPERDVIVAAYRKAYLARLHKDMLKNIVSGDDLHHTKSQYVYDTDVKIAPLTGSATYSNTIKSAFADAMTLGTAVVKGEGGQIGPSPLVNRYSLNAAQLAVCKKLGMDPGQYAQQIEKYGL